MALLALPVLAAPAKAATPRTFVLPEAVDSPAVVGGAAFYVSETRREALVKRLDLATGQTTRVYGRPAKTYSLDALRAGGGRLAVEVARDTSRTARTAVVELSPSGAAPKTIARGSLRARRPCGSAVSLEDVSEQGELLIDTERAACRSRSRDVHTLRVYGGTAPAVVARYAEKTSDDDAHWRLAGNRLLEVTESQIRLRDLATRSIQRLRPTRRGSALGFADLHASGALVVGQVRFARRMIHQVLRLLSPGMPLAAGRVLFDDRQVVTEPLFCGARLVAHRVSAAAEQLLVFDDLAGPPRTAFSSTRPGAKMFDIAVACDPDTALISDDRGLRRTLVEVVPLAP